MVFLRGDPSDFDHWARLLGDASWAYEAVLPFFKRAETHPAGPSDLHGDSGPITVAPLDHPWHHADDASNFTTKAFIKAAVSMGMVANRDFGARPHSVWGGLWGWSAMGSAHLHSMLNRPRADTRVQRRVCDSLLAAPPRDDAEVRPDGEIRATFQFTWRGAQRSFTVAVPGTGLWSARDASRDVDAVCDDAGVPAVDCETTLKPHMLAALRDLARPASVSRVDLCKPDDTVGDVEAFVAASVSVAKITTLDCATDEVRNEDFELGNPVHM